jgi:DNA polymerase I
VVRLLRDQGMRMPMSHGGKVTEPIGFDLETKSADQLFLAPRGTFIKIAGYTDGNDVAFTTDMPELMIRLEKAPWHYSHGGFTFDLPALAFHHAANPGEWWDTVTRNAADTEILDRLDYPPQARDTGGSDDKYSLDAVAERRGVAGKTASLRDIAKKHGGFDNIPPDDPEYREYLKGDVNAIRGIISTLPNGPGNTGPEAHYAKREHNVAALNGRMTLNGLLVNLPLLEERISEGEGRKRNALEVLRDYHDLPLGRMEWAGRGRDKIEQWVDFDSPLSTLEGRKWIERLWQAFGVHNPPLTDKGQFSTKAEQLRPIAESPIIHPDLREILRLLLIVISTRTVYQTAYDHMTSDGRVHPLIVMRQASGRSSVTSPGLTVFGKRGGRHRERDVFAPEENHVFVSIDLDQVDMRGVAGHSQDRAYMRLFEPGKDVHTENAVMLFGSPDFREVAKAIGHGANYGQSANTLITKGHDPDKVLKFFDGQQREFPRLMAWKEEVRQIARSGALLDNGFGRKMRPDPERAHTQGPALMGQGAAADIMKECLLRLDKSDPAMRDFMKLTIHDEVLFSFPEAEAEELTHIAKKAMTFSWKGVPITCDVSKPGKSWGEVSAK